MGPRDGSKTFGSLECGEIDTLGRIGAVSFLERSKMDAFGQKLGRTSQV